MKQVGAVGDVDAAVAGLEAGGDQQAVGEDRHLVGLAGALGVFEDDDLVVRFLAGLDLRIDLAAGDPEPAGRVEVHLDRLGQQRVGGEEVDLEALGELQGLALQLRVGIGNGGVLLGQRGAGQKEQSQEGPEGVRGGLHRSSPGLIE